MIKCRKAKGNHSSGAADFVLLHGRICFVFVLSYWIVTGGKRNKYVLT